MENRVINEELNSKLNRRQCNYGGECWSITLTSSLWDAASYKRTELIWSISRETSLHEAAGVCVCGCVCMCVCVFVGRISSSSLCVKDCYFLPKYIQYARMKCSLRTRNEQSSRSSALIYHWLALLSGIYIQREIRSVGLMTSGKLSLKCLMRKLL